MIGRGTRLSEHIFGFNQHKKEFYIFDYCDNFTFFELNPDGQVTTTTLSLTERLFHLKLDLIFLLQNIFYQEDEFAKELYNKLKQEILSEIKNLNTARIDVRAKLQYVHKYNNEKAFEYLSKVETQEIKNHISSLLIVDKDDNKAKLFDLKVLNVEVSLLDKTQDSKKSQEEIVRIASVLENMTTIPQIKAKIDVIKEVQLQAFWSNLSLSNLERVRLELRELMQFLKADESMMFTININDNITQNRVIEGINVETIKTYEQKVLDYLLQNTNNEVIVKIKNLEQITESDLKELERILWQELGTKEDYLSITNKDNLAVFVRSLIGLDQDAINHKFGKFLTDNIFNLKQQEFVKAMIDYVRQNGDITNDIVANESPFDRYGAAELFGQNIGIILDIINQMHKVVVVS